MSNCVHPEVKLEEELPTEPKKRMCAYLRKISEEGYKKGYKEGYKIGCKIGYEKGLEEVRDEHIRKMIALSYAPEEISKITGVSVEELKERYNFTDTEPAPSSGS